jgi:hypothetical protein
VGGQVISFVSYVNWICPAGWLRVADLAADRTGETVTKSDREIMEILESYDLTRCAHSAAQLAGCDPKTVQRYVALREAGGGDPLVRSVAVRPKLIDPFLAKVEELVDRSKGKIRADRVHERLVAMGFAGTEPHGRRAVRAAKLAWRGRSPAHLPAVGAGTGAVAAVRLGRRAADQRA